MNQVKPDLTDLRHPPVKCPKGHAYRVPLRYFKRNIRRARQFVCPRCLTSFRLDANGRLVI